MLCMAHIMPHTCMQRAILWPIWSSEAVLRCRVRLLRLKHHNLSLLRSRVGLRLHLCDWGTGIDVAGRTVYALYWWSFIPYAPLNLCSYWGCGQVFHIMYNTSRSVLEPLLEFYPDERYNRKHNFFSFRVNFKWEHAQPTCIDKVSN